jgi:hypothetical protein
MTRPLHFFGPPGLLGMVGGAAILVVLLMQKIFFHTHIFLEHGPLMILGMMLCLFGVQLLAVGLVGELLMRTHFESRTNPMYRIERAMGAARASSAASEARENPLAAKRAVR